MKVYCNECKHFKDNFTYLECRHDNNLVAVRRVSAIDRYLDNLVESECIYTPDDRNKDNACYDFEKKTQGLWQRIKGVIVG